MIGEVIEALVWIFIIYCLGTFIHWLMDKLPKHKHKEWNK